MTRNEFTAMAASIARHGMTAGAGLLAARGLDVPGEATEVIPAIAVAAAAMAWSWIEKSHVLARLTADTPTSDLEDLFSQLAAMRSKGANPILIANIAQSAVAIATHEAVVAHPELVQQPSAVPSQPAAAQPSPAAGSDPLSPPPGAPPPGTIDQPQTVGAVTTLSPSQAQAQNLPFQQPAQVQI